MMEIKSFYFHDKFISNFINYFSTADAHKKNESRRRKSDGDNNKAIKLITNGNIFLFQVSLWHFHQLIESDLSILLSSLFLWLFIFISFLNLKVSFLFFEIACRGGQRHETASHSSIKIHHKCEHLSGNLTPFTYTSCYMHTECVHTLIIRWQTWEKEVVRHMWFHISWLIIIDVMQHGISCHFFLAVVVVIFLFIIGSKKYQIYS